MGHLRFVERLIGIAAKKYITSFYYRYYFREKDRIRKILSLDEKSIGYEDKIELEQALPGFSRYRRTGYFRYMLARYLYCLPYISRKRCLDAACGLGWGSYLIAGSASKITAIDLDPAVVEQAKKLWPNDNINFKVLSVTHLSGLGEIYDVILGFELIEHLRFEDGKVFLNQSFDCLSQNGTLILSSFFPSHPEQARREEKNNPYHLHIYTKAEIHDLLSKCGFRNIAIIGKSMLIAKK